MVLIAFNFIPRSMRQSNQPRSPDVGNILECGGKRSATPLCLASFARIANHFEKAPSPLRFAGALQNVGLMTRQPKLHWSVAPATRDCKLGVASLCALKATFG